MKKIFALNFLLIIFLALATALPRAAAGSGENPVLEDSISLDVKNMNILDVLRLIAEQSGLNVVTSRNVTGNVTVKLHNVQIKDALNAILAANNFTFVLEGDIVHVYTYQDVQQKEQMAKMETKVFILNNVKANDIKPVILSIKSPRGRMEIDAKTNQVVVTDVPEVIHDMAAAISTLDRELITQVFKLNYAEAKDLNTKLLDMIPKQEGEVFVDERTNSVIVRAMPAVIKKAEVLIKSWDQRSTQVLIEARIMEITVDKSKSFGLDWQYKAPGDHNVDLSGKVPFSLTAGGVFKIGTLSADDYAVTLQMLEATTDVNLLSAPRITVMDNKEANIMVGSSEPYLVTYVDKETQTQTQDTKYIDVGIKLKVTPRIGSDDFIMMNIHPEVSSSRRVAEVSNSLAVDTTQADTTVAVKNGDTIVMGGLIKDRKEKIINKIPVIGNLPILGWLFRSSQDTTSKRELIVFITPHILKAESGRDQAVDQAFERAKKNVTPPGK